MKSWHFVVNWSNILVGNLVWCNDGTNIGIIKHDPSQNIYLVQYYGFELNIIAMSFNIIVKLP